MKRGGTGKKYPLFQVRNDLNHPYTATTNSGKLHIDHQNILNLGLRWQISGMSVNI